MSNRVYICKNFLKDTATVMGTSTVASSSTSNVQLASQANGLTLQNYPNLVYMQRVSKSSDKDLCTSGNGIAPAKTSRVYWQDAKLKFYNGNSVTDYQNSAFYADRDLYNLHFEIQARYFYGHHRIQTLTLICSGEEVPAGQSYSTIPILEQFPNLFYDAGYHIPLSEVYVDTASSPAISRADGGVLNTLTAVELLKTTSNISPVTIQGYEIKSDTSQALFSGTLPDYKQGKLFVTRLKVKELSNIHCMYSYQKSQNTNITSFAEPISNLTIKNQDTFYDIFEYTTSNYRNPSKFTNMLSHDINSVSSSYDSSNVKVVKQSGGTINSYDTGMLWGDLEKIAWFDCVFIRCYFPGRITDWYTLAQCITEGIPTQEGETQVTIEMLLPDLCNLVPQSTQNAPDYGTYTSYSINDLYPYNPLELTLEMGYQSDFPTSSGYNSGIYVGTKKLRRLFAGKNEISHFVADTEDSYTIGTKLISGRTSSIIDPTSTNNYKYYATGTIDVGVTVKKAILTGTSLNTGNASISWSGSKITWGLNGTTANQSVAGIITYTY